MQACSQDFTLGGTEAARVHFFDNFCSLHPQNLSSPIFFNTSDRQNSVTLLNKAGPTSQQSQFISVKKPTQSMIVGHGPPWQHGSMGGCEISEDWGPLDG